MQRGDSEDGCINYTKLSAMHKSYGDKLEIPHCEINFNKNEIEQYSKIKHNLWTHFSTYTVLLFICGLVHREWERRNHVRFNVKWRRN